MPPTPPPIPLRLSTLRALRPPLRLPTYDPSSLTPGILHIGAGNFHRAHQARYLHDLFQLSPAHHHWGILAASTLPSPLHTSLPRQDCLYTLVERSASTTTASVIASILAYLPPSPPAILRALADPSIRILSLTITEGGYQPSAAATALDAARYNTAAPPATVFGLLLAALRHRRRNRLPPFTVLSCDNLPSNGRAARAAVLALADRVDPPLAAWVRARVRFPCTMVDRITPTTTAAHVRLVRDRFAVADAAPVVCEPFSQWLLEDAAFPPDARPPLEDVGARFVPDVAPFERMKLAVLNAGHATIAYAAALLAHRSAHAAMADPRIAAFLRKVQTHEVLPHVRDAPAQPARAYFETVATRFANPAVNDPVARLCFDGSSRQPKFVVPCIRRRRAAGGRVDGLALVSALWCRYCYGTGERGEVFEDNDPAWAELTQIAKRSKAEPAAWLAQKAVYGDLARDEAFVKVFAGWLDKVWTDGAASAIDDYLHAS